MQYRHTSPNMNYEDLASGTVLQSAPGFPGFPVRLASELFSLALDDLSLERPVTLFDPFCGSAQLLTTVGFLHKSRISQIVGSDIDPAAVELASRNLALLTAGGLQDRVEVLNAMQAEFGKESHKLALESADRLAALPGPSPATMVRSADALNHHAILGAMGERMIDVVISDLPYGEQTGWLTESETPVDSLLRVLGSTLPAETIVVLVGRGRKLGGGSGLSYRTLRIGRRVAVFYRAGTLQ